MADKRREIVLILILLILLFGISFTVFISLIEDSMLEEMEQNSIISSEEEEEEEEEEGDEYYISRQTWGAQQPKMLISKFEFKPSLVVIFNDFSNSCNTTEECIVKVQKIQQKDQKDLPDISKHFLIGGDGKIYVGRGWNIIGILTSQFIKQSTVEIGFLGGCPTMKQIDALQHLINVGYANDKLSLKYTITTYTSMFGVQPDACLDEKLQDILNYDGTYDILLHKITTDRAFPKYTIKITTRKTKTDQ